MQLVSALYDGHVVHKRLRPRLHALRYRVFTLFADCSELASLARQSRFFSLNRFNLFSIHERDHGDGGNLQAHLQSLAKEAGEGENVNRFMMLCYPRVLGYVFNPLTVYFGIDRSGRIALLIYEVNNTFGERQTYVLPVREGDGGVIAQRCQKRLHVSPFNAPEGEYLFHLTPPGTSLCVGVALADAQGALLKAHFYGQRRDFSDRTLAALFLRHGWMTVKIMAAIHFEALKLRTKGLRLRRRPEAPKRSVAFGDGP